MLSSLLMTGILLCFRATWRLCTNPGESTCMRRSVENLSFVLIHVAENYAGIKVAFSILIFCLIATRLPSASTTLPIKEDLHSQTSIFSIYLINTKVLLISLMGMNNILYSSKRSDAQFYFLRIKFFNVYGYPLLLQVCRACEGKEN